MLTNIEEASALQGLARAKGRTFDTQTVHPLLVEEEIAKGWNVVKRNKRSVQLRMKKLHGDLLEDRVWSLLYRMGFNNLSDKGGGFLEVNPGDSSTPITKIDVVGIDTEIAVGIECKSAETYRKRPEFQEELGKHTLIRQRFANAVNKQYPAPFKRQVALAMFTSNINLSDNDRKRAENENVALFDEHDLEYYEDLISHLGPAAKYQFLADLLPGKSVPGLEIEIPAIRTKMGAYYCYTFSVSPEYLLKIAYVSHRAKGKASDVDTYQRMIRKSRLKSIREYIDNNGIFPTNIVLNIDRVRKFDRMAQESTQESGVAGWLTLKPAYKSAWVIDGQHRLFAYSGHSKAERGRLSVLAFENMPPSEQARLFIDINGKQKSVKQSLLSQLAAELHWNAADPNKRVTAIVSKAIQALDAEPDSPFYQRIVMADEAKDTTHCVPFAGMTTALGRGFHIESMKKGEILEYGPLWAGDNEATLKRTIYIVKRWFGLIRSSVPEWWDTGAGPGGGLAMNDGVTVCLWVLLSIFQHLDSHGTKLLQLDNDDLFECLEGYGKALGDYLAGLSEEEKRDFRRGRGIQGQTAGMRRCQQFIHDRFPTFNPDGLARFMTEEKTQTNRTAKDVVDRIETTLQQTVIEELMREYGPDEAQWWMLGVPRTVRKRVGDRHEDDDGKRGGKEYYFELMDYRNIVLENWELFSDLLGADAGRANSGKDKRTAWMNEVNEIRRIVSHASSGVSVSVEQLTMLQDHDVWLQTQVAGRSPDTALGITDEALSLVEVND